MKRVSKRIWVRILSGLAIIVGGCSLFGCAKLYGPPPPSPIQPTDSIQKTIEFEIEP